MEKFRGRIHTLDGWRGVAILLVLAEHSVLGDPSARASFGSQPWANLGNFGVDVFFVISGYIITARLLEEKQASSRINLRQFYSRRAFRILPLVCVYLSVLAVAATLLNISDFHRSEVLGSLFFFRNYQISITRQGLYTMHFWSLSVEEHFYLIWPFLLSRLDNRRVLWVALTGAVSCGLWRLYDCTHPDGPIGRMLTGFDTWHRQARTDARFDGLLLGSALAIILTSQPVRAFILRNFPKETPWIGALLLLFNLKRTDDSSTLTSYALLIVVLASTLVVEEGLAYKWLNSRPLVWIGTISYSAYIWQQIFLTGSFPWRALAPFPFNILCVFAVAALSFHLIEKPFIKFGKSVLARPEPVRTVTAATWPALSESDAPGGSI